MENVEDTNEIIRKERRKLFFRLNVIPWILVVILLGAYTSFLFVQNKNIKANAVEVKALQVEAVQKKLAKWDITPYGEIAFKWEPAQNIFITNYVSITNDVQSEILSSLNSLRDIKAEQILPETIVEKMIVTNVETVILTNVVTDYKYTTITNFVDSHQTNKDTFYTFDDDWLAKRAGINVDKGLIRNADYIIDQWFTKYIVDPSWAAQKAELKNNLRTMINQSFDGFRTYNKQYEESIR